MINLSEGGIADMWRSEQTPEIKALSFAIQKAVKRIMDAAQHTECYADIDKLDEKTLDYFAVEMRAMYYSQSLSIDQKRKIVKNTLNWYARAGTPLAVAEMVDAVLGKGRVLEWFNFDEPPKTPGTFDIATSALMTQSIMDEVSGLIGKIKNVRSHLRRVVIDRDIASGMYHAAWMISPQDAIVPNVLLGSYESTSGDYSVGLIIPTEGRATIHNQINEDISLASGQSYAAYQASEGSTTVFNNISESADANIPGQFFTGYAEAHSGSPTEVPNHGAQDTEATGGATIIAYSEAETNTVIK